MQKFSIDDLFPDPRNPRRIQEAAAQGLQASLRAFGDLSGITWNQRTGQLVAGHQRLNALKAEAQRRGGELVIDSAGWIVLPAWGDLKEERFRLRVVDWDPITQTAANIAANNPAIGGEFTAELDGLLAEVSGALPGLFDEVLMGSLLDGVEEKPAPTQAPEPKADRAAELAEEWGVELGQVWEVPSLTVPGRCHRVMCGDSTIAAEVGLLMGEIAGIDLLHADPPYGMGKEADGVANDNLYGEKLDAFQMAWWRTWRPFLAGNASAYIWGNAPELWRLWYLGGMASSERMTLRNEIVWDKKSAGAGGISHMGAEGLRQYPGATERCLFFMLGEQSAGSVNKEDFWEGFEPIRSHLEQQAGLMGWGAKEIRSITGVGMYSHWFSKSQWTMIPEKHYAKLQSAANGQAFTRPYEQIRVMYDGGVATRAYFDNTHDNMTDVWDFPRVTGEDRHGHATPKPVALVARAIKSSCPPGGIVAEPFLGSGSTMVAAEREGRICVGAELNPGYVGVILQRLKDMGLAPRLVAGAPED